MIDTPRRRMRMQSAGYRGRLLADGGLPGFKEVVVASTCAAIGSSLYVALAAWHGALGVARSDDWTYYRSAFALARHGSFSADPWAYTMLVGHLVLAQPVIALFGNSIAALQIMVAVLSAVALTATYLVIRSYLSVGRAAFAAACLALGPIYGSLSVSYMTDVPAFALEVLVLLAGLQALRTSRFSFPWFIVSLLLGLAAFSIREYALAAPAAVSLVALRRLAAAHDPPKTRWVAVLLSLGLLAAAGMFFWRHNLPGASHVARPLQPPIISVAYLCSAAFAIALLAFPMVFLISLRAAAQVRRDRPRVTVFVSGIVVLVWALLMAANGSALPGNMLTAHGSYPETLPGEAPVVLPIVLWQALSILSLLSLLGLLTLAAASLNVRNARRGRETIGAQPPAHSAGLQLSWAFSLLMFGELAVVKLATPGVITDRYLIPIVPFIVAAALHRAGESGFLVSRFRLVATGSLAMMALLGITMVDASATFDGAKWHIATSVQRSGVPPELIDGGYEWFGYHQPGKIVDFQLNTPARSWWNRLFEKQDTCVETRYAATPPELGARTDGSQVMSRLTARTLFGVNYDLVAVRITPTCPITPGL